MELSKLSAKALEKELEKRDAARWALLDKIIEAGRGHEFTAETISKTDDLSVAYRIAIEKDRAAMHERDYRLTYHGSLKPVKQHA